MRAWYIYAKGRIEREFGIKIEEVASLRRSSSPRRVRAYFSQEYAHGRAPSASSLPTSLNSQRRVCVATAIPTR